MKKIQTLLSSFAISYFGFKIVKYLAQDVQVFSDMAVFAIIKYFYMLFAIYVILISLSFFKKKAVSKTALIIIGIITAYLLVFWRQPIF